MRLKLRGKLIITFVVIAIAGYLILSLWGTPLIRKQAENTVVNALFKDAGYLAASYKVNTGSINRGQLESMAYASGSDIWVMAISGKIEAYSGTLVPPETIQDFKPAEGTNGYYMKGDFYGFFDEDMLTVYLPLTQSIRTQGYVLLHYPLSAISKTADSNILIAYVAFGGCLIILILFIVLLDFLLVQRLHKVQTAAREYANGNLTYPIPVKGQDEIMDLAVTQADLAKQIQSAAEDQHRFLANISHDFRSPLTSIRGYMVAIQDGTIPAEMQGKYIDIVLNETDRMTSLANNLLDMTQLENGIILEKNTFDINDLIREALTSFEGRVTEKNLVFNVTFEEPHVSVVADRQRIQQVIHNLVDNAIKFSGNDSSVDLSTQLHGDKVFVSVRDHGCGIAKENLGKIWERFYKTDASRGKDKKGTGLGLSIVREIIQAHKEHIDVISTPDVGTEFIFTLPSA